MTIQKLTPEISQKMLKEICKMHPDFKRFFLDHDEKIRKINIIWKIDPDSKVEGISSPITYEITLKRYPESREDARVVAHEIIHILIWTEGYPYVMAEPYAASCDHKLDSCAREIQAIIFEPMVEARLKMYFTEICADNQKKSLSAAAKILNRKEEIFKEICDPRALLYYSCLYVKRRRLIEATCCDVEAANRYIKIYEENFQDTIVDCAEQIMSLIHRYDQSPESIKEIFNTILKHPQFCFSFQYQQEFNRFLLEK